MPMPILSEPSGRTAGEWSWTRLDQPVVACLAHSSCLESSYDQSVHLDLFSKGGTAVVKTNKHRRHTRDLSTTVVTVVTDRIDDYTTGACNGLACNPHGPSRRTQRKIQRRTQSNVYGHWTYP